MRITLHPFQRKFLTEKPEARFRAMVSGVQSGKTTALVVRLLWDLDHNRDADFLAVSPTFMMLHQAFLPKFERLAPPGLVESWQPGLLEKRGQTGSAPGRSGPGLLRR